LGGLPALAAEGRRVELRYADGLTEWYENREDGLEQGFTLNMPPAGMAGDEVLIELVLGDDLTARWAADGSTLVLVDGGGAPVLRYGGLAAWDAEGRALPARMELVGAAGEQAGTRSHPSPFPGGRGD
jgi:hypothetical protein